MTSPLDRFSIQGLSSSLSSISLCPSISSFPPRLPCLGDRYLCDFRPRPLHRPPFFYGSSPLSPFYVRSSLFFWEDCGIVGLLTFGRDPLSPNLFSRTPKVLCGLEVPSLDLKLRLGFLNVLCTPSGSSELRFLEFFPQLLVHRQVSLSLMTQCPF